MSLGGRFTLPGGHQGKQFVLAANGKDILGRGRPFDYNPHWARWLATTLLYVSVLGCAVQRRQPLPPAVLTPVWQEATLGELLEEIRGPQQAIQTLNATVEIESSVTSESQGEIVHYRDVRAFILIRRPGFLRMIGLYPVLQNKAFDMASDGEDFGLYIPSRNRFIIGKSQGGRRSQSALERLRPQHILDVLLWKAPELGREQAILEVVREGNKGYYIVHIVRSAPEGGLWLTRKFWFERERLAMERLQIFDENGEVETEVRYSDYAEVSGIPYARKILMERPQDHYGLILSVSQMKFNEPLGDDKFLLERPPGADLINLETQSLSEKG